MAEWKGHTSEAVSSLQEADTRTMAASGDNGAMDGREDTPSASPPPSGSSAGSAENLDAPLVPEQPIPVPGHHFLDVDEEIEKGLPKKAAAILSRLIASGEADINAYYHYGKILESIGNHEEALASYQKATHLWPHSALLWFRLGELRLKSGKPELAAEAFRKSLSYDAGWSRSVSRLVDAYSAYLPPDDLIPYLRELGRSHPQLPKIHIKLAEIYFSRRCFDKAWEHIAFTLKVTPDDTKLHIFAGRTLLMLGNRDLALTHLRRTVEKPIQSFKSAYLAGRLLFSLEDYTSAEAAFRYATSFNPNAPMAHFFLGCTLEKQDRPQQALVHLQRSHDNCKSFYETVIRIARIHMRLRRYAVAEEALSGLLSKNPEYGPALLAMAQLMNVSEQVPRAFEFAERAVKAMPEMAETYNLLASLLNQHGKQAASIEAARNAIRIAPDSPGNHLILGRAYLDLNMLDKAAQALNRAQELNPDDIELHAAMFELSKKRQHTGDEIVLASAFVLSPERAKPKTRGDLFKATGIHFQVVWALLLRETRTRFGRERLGYLWALIQPMMYVGVFYALFSFLERATPPGMPILPFLLTGVVPWLMFSSTLSRVQTAIQSNMPLLHFPQVKPIDVFFARALLEAVTHIAIFTILMAIAVLLSPEIRLDNIAVTIFALFLCWLGGLGAGLLVFSGTMWFRSLDKVFDNVTRLMFFSSGVFFTVTDLPAKARDYMLYNPVMHMIDFVRDGIFESYDASMSNLWYPAVFSLVLLFFGLLLQRIARDRIQK